VNRWRKRLIWKLSRPPGREALTAFQGGSLAGNVLWARNRGLKAGVSCYGPGAPRSAPTGGPASRRASWDSGSELATLKRPPALGSEKKRWVPRRDLRRCHLCSRSLTTRKAIGRLPRLKEREARRKSAAKGLLQWVGEEERGKPDLLRSNTSQGKDSSSALPVSTEPLQEAGWVGSDAAQRGSAEHKAEVFRSNPSFIPQRGVLNEGLRVHTRLSKK